MSHMLGFIYLPFLCMLFTYFDASYKYMEIYVVLKFLVLGRVGFEPGLTNTIGHLVQCLNHYTTNENKLVIDTDINCLTKDSYMLN